MTVAELTTILSVVGGLLVALGTVYGAVRSARKAAAESTVTTWQALSAEYKADRDAARVELGTIDDRYRRRIAGVEEDCRARVAELSEEIRLLRQRLFGDDRSSP